jgi:antitoxin HicB
MRYIYSVELGQDAEGRYFATCRDVPEAVTDGESAHRALLEMADALGATLALRSATQEQGVSNVRLAEQPGLSESAVRRLVNPDHLSRLDRVVAA